MGRKITIASIVAKVLKIIIIMVILVLYRIGNKGKFLGVGGTFNLNEEKTVDVEILASGVFVGFLVYNISVLLTYILTRERLLNDAIMNVIGVFLWIAVGGTALHYWDSYGEQYQFDIIRDEKSFGLSLGSLCIINGLVHAVDTFVSTRLYISKSSD